MRAGSFRFDARRTAASAEPVPAQPIECDLASERDAVELEVACRACHDATAGGEGVGDEATLALGHRPYTDALRFDDAPGVVAPARYTLRIAARRNARAFLRGDGTPRSPYAYARPSRRYGLSSGTSSTSGVCTT